MRAAVYHGRRRRTSRRSAGSDRAAAGEVLVAPILCGICGTDVHEYTHGPIVTPVEPHPLTGATNPQILGHEFSAEVLEVGAGVSHVRPGQRVSAMPLIYCGTCYLLSARAQPPVRTDGLHRPESRVGWPCRGGRRSQRASSRRLPDEIDDHQGALVEPIAVAAYGVDRGGVAPGTSVLVTGGGPIGIAHR